jgi:hypothetical protein
VAFPVPVDDRCCTPGADAADRVFLAPLVFVTGARRGRPDG